MTLRIAFQLGPPLDSLDLKGTAVMCDVLSVNLPGEPLDGNSTISTRSRDTVATVQLILRDARKRCIYAQAAYLE